MAEKHLRGRMAAGQLLRDARHLPFSHGAVRLVVQAIHPVALVFVAHDAHEEGQPAVSAVPENGQK